PSCSAAAAATRSIAGSAGSSRPADCYGFVLLNPWRKPMKTLAIPLSILAAATLGACSSNPAPAPSTISSAAPIVPQKVAYRPGTGVVENMLLTPGPISSVSGGTATGASGHAA